MIKKRQPSNLSLKHTINLLGTNKTKNFSVKAKKVLGLKEKICA